MSGTDWVAWHRAYDDPGSSLARRLEVVRERIGLALDGAPPGPLRVLSLVAGQGRDLLPVLAAHPRRSDVTATLVELDPVNAAAAREAARRDGLGGVRVVTGDAALVDTYRDAIPADLLLLCGLFGNVSDADVARTVARAGGLTRRGGTVIWTRHREEPDLAPRIDAWLRGHGFRTLYLSPPEFGFGVGAHRAGRDPVPVPPGTRLFTFRDGGVADPA